MTDIIQLAKDTIDKADIKALISWLSTEPTPQLTKGELTEKFESEWAAYTGTRYAVMVNSGSSANLIGIYSLIASDRLRNKKVVVPALCWITDIAPVIQFGLTPILCDCNMTDLSVDIVMLEDIFKKEDPACLILVSVLGLVPDMQAIADLCEKYSVILMLDNCEGFGSKFNNKLLEQYALFSTCSLYFGHHLSTIEGGMICTNDWDLYNVLKMIRSHGWDRDLEHKNEVRKINQVDTFQAAYKFYYLGFNVRATDLQAFLGSRQLKKAAYNNEKRYHNYNFYNYLVINKYWSAPIRTLDSDEIFISNLGYPVIHPKRNEIVKALIENNIEVRPLISGSMGKQPFFVNLYGAVDFPNVSIVDQYGFYVPNHPYLKFSDIQKISQIINTFTNDQNQ
jgi:CDP-4-dehydro-6-deoxyglucose reductase, E1